MSTAAHETVLAAIEAAAAGLFDVFDGYVKDSDENRHTISAPLPYVVYFGTPGYPINRRLGGRSGRAVEFQVTAVGRTAEQARWAGQKVEDHLDGLAVTVDGRRCRIRRDELDNAFTSRDDTWTRPDGGPLFNDFRRYVIPV